MRTWASGPNPRPRIRGFIWSLPGKPEHPHQHRHKDASQHAAAAATTAAASPVRVPLKGALTHVRESHFDGGNGLPTLGRNPLALVDASLRGHTGEAIVTNSLQVLTQGGESRIDYEVRPHGAGGDTGRARVLPGARLPDL